MSAYTVFRLLACGLALFGTNAGSVRFAPGFPLSIPGTGCAIVTGTAKAEAGLALHNAKVFYFENGGESRKVRAVLYPDGSYFAILPGLVKGRTYQVKAEVVMTGNNQIETFSRIGKVLQK